MTIASFAPGTSVFLNAGTISTNIAIPVGGSILAVTNIGQGMAFVAIGTTGTLAAIALTDLPIMPSQQAILTVGTNTTLAAVALAQSTGLVITVGN